MSADIAIIQFPGSNTERETLMACKRAGLNPVEFLWNQRHEDLKNYSDPNAELKFNYRYNINNN